MAKLYAEISSDKGGRVVDKGGNEYITIIFKHKLYPVFEVTFKPDNDKRGELEVMSYFDGEKQTIPYDPIPF